MIRNLLELRFPSDCLEPQPPPDPRMAKAWVTYFILVLLLYMSLQNHQPKMRTVLIQGNTIG